jgi:hypothetical protein
MTMQTIDLNILSAHEYLKNGFLTENGDLKDRFTGLYSLALAYQLHQEGTSVEQVKSVFDDFIKLGDNNLTDKTQDRQLEKPAFEMLGKIINSPKTKKSAALQNLFDAALPWLKDWQNVAGLVVHLERSIHQLALITILSK